MYSKKYLQINAEVICIYICNYLFIAVAITLKSIAVSLNSLLATKVVPIYCVPLNIFSCLAEVDPIRGKNALHNPTFVHFIFEH